MQLAAGMLAHELEAAKRQARLERRHVRLPARRVRRNQVQLPARLADQTLARQSPAVARTVHQLGQPVLGVGFPVELRKSDEGLSAPRRARRSCAAARRAPAWATVGLASYSIHPRREITRRRAGGQKN